MKYANRTRPLLAGIALMLASLCAQAQVLAPMDATYVVSRGILTLGEADFRLRPAENREGCWRYEYHAKPKGLARLVIGEVREISYFCVVDNRIRSQHFEFRREDKAKDNFSLEFDWDKNVVRASSGELRQLTDDMMDRLVMQLAVQRWVAARNGVPGPETFTVTKVEDDRAKTYEFRITGAETVTVPAGTIDTVLVERVNDKKKSTKFWVSPARDYAPVRVQQIKDGDEEFRMELKY